jgi:hypothetical protein
MPSESTFSSRLIEALEFQGITDRQQQIEKVADICKVTTRTAEKYLMAKQCPNRIGLSRRLFMLAKSLGVDGIWLYDGRGIPPQFARFLKSLSEWELNKLNRYAIRLLNQDKKALRLGDMAVAGQITRQQFFGMM